MHRAKGLLIMSHRKSKLHLQTETIMPLGQDDLEVVHGGATPGTTVTTTAASVAVASSRLCLAGSIAATRSSQGCAAGAGQWVARGNQWVRDKVTVSF